MNPLRNLCLLACLIAVVCASPKHKKDNYAGNSLKPSEWLSVAELQAAPSVDGVTLQQLENMPVEEGEQLLQKLYFLSQIKFNLAPSFVPSPSNIPCYIIKPNGQNNTVSLSELVQTLKQQPNFGNEEVTIFITGLPQTTQSVNKATKSLVQAYRQRYNSRLQPINNQNNDYDYGKTNPSSSEEDYNESWKQSQWNSADLIVINLGATLTNFKRIAMLDVDQTGAMIGNVLVQMTNELDVPQEIVNVVAQGIAAHVAGVAGRQYIRLTGHQLRRITALDPSKIFAKNRGVLTGLARGDAEFVDAIHTSPNGMGTRMRVGDVDFYPNGLANPAPGVDNVVEASMRATRYYAETVRPGNERNFPAVAANSLQQYNNNNGNGKRAYMGINADFDLEGDYILQVNAKSPFGKKTPAGKQITYHGIHQSWANSNSQDY